MLLISRNTSPKHVFHSTWKSFWCLWKICQTHYSIMMNIIQISWKFAEISSISVLMSHCFQDPIIYIRKNRISIKSKVHDIVMYPWFHEKAGYMTIASKAGYVTKPKSGLGTQELEKKRGTWQPQRLLKRHFVMYPTFVKVGYMTKGL